MKRSKRAKIEETTRNEFYDVMLADSDRLLTTVEQVLEASKTKEKSRKLNLSQIEVGELLKECADLVRSRYNLDKNVIEVAQISEEIFVSGDLTELRTVFGNLLDNAVKYSKEIIDVSVKMRIRQKSTIEIRIKDKGVGLSSSELKTIFRRFYRRTKRRYSNHKGNRARSLHC